MNIPKLRFKDNNGNDYPQWEKKKLGDIVQFLDNKRKPLEQSERIHGKYPYYGASGIIDYINNYIFDEELVLLSEDGANIIDRNYPICYIATGKYWVNNHAHVLKTKSQYLNKFLCEALERLNYNKYNTGTAQPKLNQDICKNILLNIPILHEQEKIANFFSTIDKKIKNLANTITSLENQKKGLLQQIFSQKLRFKDKNGNNYPNWEKKKLEDIGSFSRGGNLSKSDLSKKGTSCILYGELYTYYNEFATEIKSKTLNTTNLVLSKKYDVLLPLSGETAEDISTCTCIFFDDIALGSDLLIFRSSFFDGRFMSLLLKYKYKYKIAQIAQGKSIVHISEKNIKNINIKIPCIEEQQNIADFILIFTKKLENQKAQLEHWKQIKKGLLQQMFV